MFPDGKCSGSSFLVAEERSPSSTPAVIVSQWKVGCGIVKISTRSHWFRHPLPNWSSLPTFAHSLLLPMSSEKPNSLLFQATGATHKFLHSKNQRLHCRLVSNVSSLSVYQRFFKEFSHERDGIYLTIIKEWKTLVFMVGLDIFISYFTLSNYNKRVKNVGVYGWSWYFYFLFYPFG